MKTLDITSQWPRNKKNEAFIISFEYCELFHSRKFCRVIGLIVLVILVIPITNPSIFKGKSDAFENL